MPIILDKIDKRILFELDKNARIPETTLAKIVGRSKESVRYRIKQLQEKSIIHGFTIWIDPARLGYSSAKLYLTLANKPSQKKAFIEYVKKDKRLFWLGIAEGAWNAGLTFFVKSNAEFFQVKNDLLSNFKDLILDSHTASLVGVYIHEKTFLVPTSTTWLSLFEQIESYQLDEIEKKILKLLFVNARTSLVDLARSCNSTLDIIRHRLKRIEERKIIVRYTTQIDYSSLGYEFYKTFLYFHNLTKADEHKLMEYAKQNPNIIHLIKQISPWDIELEIMCHNYQEYNRILAGLTQEFSAVINKVETAILSEDYVFPSSKMIFE